MAVRVARYHDYVRFSTPGKTVPYSVSVEAFIAYADPDEGGSGRIPLNSPKVIGVASSRGTRRCVPHVLLRTHRVLQTAPHSYQEDFYSYVSLSLNPEELRLTVKKKLGIDWDPDTVGEPLARQAAFIGIYDG